MGFEVKYTFHPRKEDGGYDTEIREQKLVKVGKPFDDTSMEKLAAAIMAQLARRDVWVVDVEVYELIKKSVSFKECKDGKGITLKGRRYSFNEAAQLISEDLTEEAPRLPEGMQPHELIAMQKNSSSIENLYDPNKQVPIQKLSLNVNQNKIIYKVIFDPPLQYVNEAKRLGLKFVPDKEYPVHQIIQHPTGKLELQKLAITDDMGRVVTVDEKFFTTVGTGLLADKQLNFSGSTGRPAAISRRPKLMYEDQMVMETSDPKTAASCSTGIPLDDGVIPEHLLAMPDIRSKR